MTKGLVPYYSRPEHLADPFLGTWHAENVFSQTVADAVMQEVFDSGSLEPMRDDSNSATNQKFERLVVDLTREHGFPQLEELGRQIGRFVVLSTGGRFPALGEFQIDEAAVQIYPPDVDLALGWHRDHPDDKHLVMSAILAGRGDIGFTEKTYEEAKRGVADDEIVATISTEPLDVVYFRANGLYEREDGSDIRETHAVTRTNPGVPRFTIQYRQGVNAAAYGNVPVNDKAPLRQRRPPLVMPVGQPNVR
jgi:hypothetical protein